MTQLFDVVMNKLYGKNIWDGFVARDAEPDVQGWNGKHPSLGRLISSPGPKIVVDVGVWKGQSTITMANAMKQNRINGVVIAVDTFLGSHEHWLPERELFQRHNGLPDLYQSFMTNVHEAELTGFVIPMAQTSSTACQILKRFGIRPNIVHVDAAHEYREALQDIEDYWDILQDGGYLIGDDYHRVWPGVVQAAGEFSARVRQPLVIEKPKFILQKS